MATAVSPIMPIASFGIYAALGVFLNYVLAITLFRAFPPVLASFGRNPPLPPRAGLFLIFGIGDSVRADDLALQALRMLQASAAAS